LQKAKLGGRKRVEFAMRSGEDAHQVAFNLEWDGDFRVRPRLASHVIGIAIYVGRITHLAGGSDVADHALGPDFQPVAFTVNRASTNAGQHELSLLRMMKIQVDFDTAKRGGDFAYDALDDFFNIEGSGDALSRFLKADKFG
jgi:hypothetical protein